MYAWVIKCPDGKYVGYEFEDILFVTPCILNGAHWVSKEAAQIELEQAENDYPDLRDLKIVKIEIREV